MGEGGGFEFTFDEHLAQKVGPDAIRPAAVLPRFGKLFGDDASLLGEAVECFDGRHHAAVNAHLTHA